MNLWVRRCDLAVKKAAQDAALRHKQAGVPLVRGDRGEIKLIQPADIVVDYDILNAPYPEV